MAKYVGRDGFGDSRLLAELLANLPHPGQMHGKPCLLPRKEPVLGLAPAPVDAEQLQQLGRKFDLAGELPLAFPDVTSMRGLSMSLTLSC